MTTNNDFNTLFSIAIWYTQLKYIFDILWLHIIKFGLEIIINLGFRYSHKNIGSVESENNKFK